MIDDGANGAGPPAQAAAGEATSAARDLETAAGLVARAEALCDEPVRAEQLAAAAAAMLERAGDDPDGRSFALLFRAFAVILRCRRPHRRVEEGDEIVRQALAYLCVAPPVSVERAALLAGVAQLRRAQRRLDEAAGLFVHAGRMFAQAGSRQGEAACRAQAGMMLVAHPDPRPARFELARAFVAMDAALAPALAARVGVVLAWCELAAGRSAQARRALHGAQALYGCAPGAGEEIFRAWWEARIAALGDAGDPGDAGARLDAVRRRLNAEGSIAEAARCTLDLLAARVDAGRLDGLGDLAPELLNAFECRPLAMRPAMMIDLLAFYALQRSSRYRSALGAIRHYLAGLRPHRGERPDLIPGIEDLADRLLLAARQEAGR
jgi:hypothetical protein